MKTTLDKIIFSVGVVAIICALGFIWLSPKGMIARNPDFYGITE